MQAKQFDAILNDTYEHAVAVRAFAVSLDVEAPKVAKLWHTLADHLHDAAQQALTMATQSNR